MYTVCRYELAYANFENKTTTVKELKRVQNRTIGQEIFLKARVNNTVLHAMLLSHSPVVPVQQDLYYN